MNLFEQAITKNELLKFAFGTDEYFIVDREYGEHSVLNSWINYIIPLIEAKGLEYVTTHIVEMISIVLNCDEIDEQLKSENILYHLHVYYYLDSEKRIQASNLITLNHQILKLFERHLALLKKSGNPKEQAFLNAIHLIRSRGGLVVN